MDKRQIIDIISSAAQIYNEQLCDKSLLLLYDNLIQPQGIEIVASPTNFLHLTGMILRQGCTAESFYRKALSHKLSTNDFDVRDGASLQKMQVLLQTVNLSVNAKMIGDYSGSHIYIQTGKVTGSISSCLGLISTRNYYVPQTVLREDTRNNIIKSFKVLAILQKRVDEKKYNTVLSIGKKVEIIPLLQKVSKFYPIDQSLLHPRESHSSQANGMETDASEKSDFPKPVSNVLPVAQSSPERAPVPEQRFMRVSDEEVSALLQSGIPFEARASADKQSKIIKYDAAQESTIKESLAAFHIQQHKNSRLR